MTYEGFGGTGKKKCRTQDRLNGNAKKKKNLARFEEERAGLLGGDAHACAPREDVGAGCWFHVDPCIAHGIVREKKITKRFFFSKSPYKKHGCFSSAAGSLWGSPPPPAVSSGGLTPGATLPANSE